MIEIVPVRKLNAEVTVPGSKYFANRVIIMAALASGISVLENVPDNDDINHAIGAIKKLGIGAEKKGTTLTINGGHEKLKACDIDVGESGTLLRFVTALCSVSKGTSTITGSERIKERPILELLDSLNSLGITTESLNSGFPPVKISGGSLKGGTVRMSGNISSQFISAILLISCYAEKDVEIIMESDPVSKSYIDMTIELMHEFGVEVERKGYESFWIMAGQRYTAMEYHIPGDLSSSNYFLAAAAMTQGTIRVNGIDTKKNEGEADFQNILVEMGCMLRKNRSWVDVIGLNKLSPVKVDMSSMPDSVQTLAAIAACIEGKTVIRNIGHLRHKESNRIEDTAAELRKLGVSVETSGDEMIIIGGKINPGIIDPHNDHRLAMSLSLLGLVNPGIKIMNPECVNKSFPEYWDKLKEIGVELRYE